MNIGRLLSKSARAFPESRAIVYGTGESTYARFNARANRLAHALRRLGVGPGHNVAILMYNRPEMLESMFACFKAGCGAVPINFRLHPREFAFIIDHSEASVVLVSPEFDEPIAEIRERIPRARSVITVSEGAAGLLDYEALLAAESDEFDDAVRNGVQVLRDESEVAIIGWRRPHIEGSLTAARWRFVFEPRGLEWLIVEVDQYTGEAHAR